MIEGPEFQEQVNKRLTLNWLIQGAAQHAGMTFHHLVRDELDALNPHLLRLYDQYALINLLQYWHLEAALIFGSPRRFWRRATTSKRHPFHAHALLSQYGGELAAAGRSRALERCCEKGVTRAPLLFQIQVASLVGRLKVTEAEHKLSLISLATRCTSQVWGIPRERLNADLTNERFGTPIRTPNLRAALLSACIVGLGGVVQGPHSLTVKARGTNWQLLAKELVKGTAELICLHGLTGLDDETCKAVLQAADRLDWEPWMLQTGGELWRRMLAVVSVDAKIADVLMHLSRLSPKSLERIVRAVIEEPETARRLFEELGRDER